MVEDVKWREEVALIRVLLTFWYATTALLGPSLCCCALRGAVASSPPIHYPSAEAPGSNRSCCGGESDRSPATPRSPGKNQTPENCPCKQKAGHIPTTATVSNATEVFSQLRALDSTQFDWAATSGGLGVKPLAIDCSFTDCLSPAKLGGRALLSACQILRC
jgi:hypothetical protein